MTVALLVPTVAAVKSQVGARAHRLRPCCLSGSTSVEHLVNPCAFDFETVSWAQHFTAQRRSIIIKGMEKIGYTLMVTVVDKVGYSACDVWGVEL